MEPCYSIGGPAEPIKFIIYCFSIKCMFTFIYRMDTKAAIEMLNKLTRMLAEGSVDDSLKDAIDVMTNAFNNYEQLDHDMIARLNDIFSNELIKKKEYTDIIKAIGQGSTVVYFKSAQLFKVYKKIELEQLLGGQLRTIYKQFNESYELVSNESKQKIVMLCDVSLTSKIESIKTYIVEFMINEGIINFNDSDIVCYKGKDALEIIINNYYVENQKEHNEIVEKLLKYITQQEKSSNIVHKIHTSSYSEFDGMKMISMPSEKELIATKYIEPLLTMISNVHQCSGYRSHITLNVTNIINDNSVHTTTNNNNAEIDSNSGNVYEFIKYIRDEKPDWYQESTWIKKDVMLEKYNELFENVSKKSFSTMFKDKLYKSEKRQMVEKTRYMFVKLFKISDL